MSMKSVRSYIEGKLREMTLAKALTDIIGMQIVMLISMLIESLSLLIFAFHINRQMQLIAYTLNYILEHITN